MNEHLLLNNASTDERDNASLWIRYAVIAGMILLAALSRLIPHPPNFAPIGAMALFGGACFAKKRLAFVVPLAAMLISDVGLAIVNGSSSFGFHRLTPVVYGSFATIVCLGFLLRERRQLFPIAAATLAASVLFFVLTNFGVWAMGSWYPKTWEGLVTCYVAAIPFFHNTLLGDAVYSLTLFGGLAIAEAKWPAVRPTVLVPSM